MSALKKFFLILTALAMMIGVVAASASPAAAAPLSAATCKQWHTVARGEYLVMIARLYNTDWRALVEINDLKNPNRIYPGQSLCVSLTGTVTTPVAAPSTSSGIRVSATSVHEDKDVTLAGKNLVANSRYSVYFSKFGTSFSNAILMGYVYADTKGAFTRTYRIPGKLVDVSKIYVYLDNGSDATYNWFINATSDTYTGGDGAPAFSFSVTSVKSDKEVKIKTTNMPPNVTFNVYMGKTGTKGVDGILVGTLRADEDGSVRGTFDIPEKLQGRSKIDIRLQNDSLGISAYQTFEN
jgi:LysM repeat protein